MAPKRPAPPPPTVASSEEIASSSGSEEEEEIAYSPPPVPAPKRPAPPSSPVANSEDTSSGSGSEEEEEIAHSPPPVPVPKRPAGPPPPPPPVASSEETASGSDSEEEEEIAHSPPPVPGPKRPAPPPPPPPPVASAEETASGSGSEEEEEEGEEEEIAHSLPPVPLKTIATLPRKDQESEASDEDEDGEEEEEEDDEKANHVIPSSATKNPPPPPAAREESETSDEEVEEEADDEMPQTKPAPNQEIAAKGAKRPSGPFQRTWSFDDEFRILEVLAAHRLEHGTLPQTDVLANAIAGKLDKRGYSLSELQRKVKSLQSQYTKAVKKGAPPGKDQDRRLFDLCKNVWPSATKSATKAAANSCVGRELDEMCQLYPFLAEEVKVLEKAHPGLFKREFSMIDDSKARALDEKIKKHRRAQMKLHLRRHDLTKEVTKTLMDLGGLS